MKLFWNHKEKLFVTLLISLIPVLTYPLEIECYDQHSLLSV